MAFDNDTGNFDFKFDENSINELKQKYQEGVENHRVGSPSRTKGCQ